MKKQQFNLKNSMMRPLLLFFIFALGSTQQSCSSNDEPVVQEPVEDDKNNNGNSEGNNGENNKPDEPNTPKEPYFVDEFETFNEAIWTKEAHESGWTNQELQSYDEAHVSIGTDNGKSVLILTAERQGNNIYSGRVNSKGKKSFKYGRIEASIKLPKTANGLWPAFWLMGDNNKQWPACGEIDIMEMGEHNGIANGTQETFVNTAIHYGTNTANHEQEYFQKNFQTSLQDGKYHTYALDWEENWLVVSIDGENLYTYDISQASGRYEYFHDNFYILFNLAVGGSFTGITDMNDITALNDGEKVQMCIDWVKLYR
ncbi:glycoside hydrolase family 16 protein [uncultured Bacteroides sp.]|uniref:glycoside hydrolase family 16 protein n=1 Tax=uncultured Bacteroides sp. TaxID=162156 RepID=UPI002633F464|nr:glycoside hydrolase family 16 protein [uncultured Bacteroides sp.]